MGQTRPKGSPKTPGSGRKPGTPNRATQTLLEKCEANGLDVFEALIELAMTDVNPDKRFEKMMKIAPYLYAQRRAVEVTSEIDVRLIERVKELEALPDAELKKIVEKK